jgi:hypothetical protein
MFVLIATTDLHVDPHVQRDRAVDGELVTPVVLECPNPACEVCPQAWFGLTSHGSTDQAMVVDRPGVTESALRSRIHDWLDCRGAIDAIVQAADAGEYEVDGVRVDDPVAAVDELVTAHLAEIRAICERFAVGTIVSRLGQLVAPRQLGRVA